jgi:hypothetical protein
VNDELFRVFGSLQDGAEREANAAADRDFTSQGGLLYDQWSAAPIPTVKIQFCGTNLDAKDTALVGKGSSDPYLSIRHMTAYAGLRANGGNGVEVWKSKTIKRTLTKKWGEVEIPLELLCAVDQDRLLLIECYDYDLGSPDLIGICGTSVRELLEQKEGLQWELTNSDVRATKKAKGENYTDSGTLAVKGLQSGAMERKVGTKSAQSEHAAYRAAFESKERSSWMTLDQYHSWQEQQAAARAAQVTHLPVPSNGASNCV